MSLTSDAEDQAAEPSVYRLPKLVEREVLILGAGFSIAVSPSFPTTDKLGTEATRIAHVARRRLPAGGFKDGNFETWLSRLAEDQPYFSEAENRENRFIFAKVTEAIVDILRSRELAAFDQQPRPWLYELISLAHHRELTIVSLNYDTIVEVCVASFEMWSTEVARQVAIDDVLERLPPPPSPLGGHVTSDWHVSYDGQTDVAPTLRLLKLHGSLDWHWSSGDWTGATLRRTTVGSRFGHPVDDPALRDREAPGLDPFIVPPTATKSEYYRNPLTRRLWRRAAAALRSADRIALLGYSLPQADLVMSGMLAEAIKGRAVTVEVVNPKPQVPVTSLERLGARAVKVTKGAKCIEDFAAAYCARAATELVDELRDRAPHDEPVGLVLEWAKPSTSYPPRMGRAIAGFEPRGEEMLLTLQEHGVVSSASVELSDLVASLGGVKRLVVPAPDGRVVPIIGAIVTVQGGLGQRRWLTLVAAGMLADS